MDADTHQEVSEVAAVAVAHAGADPGAVVVVDLNTAPALITVKSPGRPHELARGAVT